MPTAAKVPFKPALHMGVEVRLPKNRHPGMPMGRGVITHVHADGDCDVMVYPGETLPLQTIHVPPRHAATDTSGWWEPTALTETR